MLGAPLPAAVADDDVPDSHKKALQFIEDVTARADEVQRHVLDEILLQNAGAEYLRRHDPSGTTIDAAAFKRLIPVVTYEDLQQDIHRIAQGDTTPILCCRPILEFLNSSGTSGGETKLIPTIQEDQNRGALFYSLLMPVMNQFVPGLNKGKGMYFMFVRPESRTPGGLLARSTLTSYYKSRHFVDRSHDPYNAYTSPIEAILCPDSYQSMYAQLLCGLVEREEVLRMGAVFAFGLIHAIRFLEGYWPALCRDLRAGTADPNVVTDASVRDAVSRVLRRPEPDLAAAIEAECGNRGSWRGIIARLWPNTRYINVIVTGAMAQYVPWLDFYSGKLPLASTVYAASECCLGLNLQPLCKPSEVAYTLIPTMAYFEFLPAHRGNGSADDDNPDASELLELADVKLGQEYELVVTTYAGLYRYRLGDVLRVAGFKNKAPRFNFVCRKNVALSIEADKTDEAELHRAVERAARHLEPFSAALVEYTSYADTSTIPGHYVLYWELRTGVGASPPVPPSVFEDCCLAVEESLNSVYRQGRAVHKSIGPLELRVVEEGTFDELMNYALSRGASINQYKPPRCIKFEPMLELLNSQVRCNFFSPKCPTWMPGHKQWNISNSSKK